MQEKKENWKMVTLLIGAVVGLVAGLIAAYIMIQRAEEEATRPRLSAGEGVKVGLGVLTLLRLLSDISVKK